MSSKTRAKTLLVVGLMVLALILLTYPKLSAGSGSPWFNRDRNLDDRWRRLIVGPVDAEKGISGLVELGRARKDVTANLGAPLVPATSPNHIKGGITIDSPEDQAQDFYDGIFAWIEYEDGRVSAISFDMTGLTLGMNKRQEVLLATGAFRILLVPEMSQQEVQQSVGPRGKVSPNGNIVIGRATLEFDSRNRLEQIKLAIP